MIAERFYLVDKDCIQTTINLRNKGFKENPPVLYDIEQPEPLMIIIDQESKTFFWIDNKALIDCKKIVKSKFKNIIKKIIKKDIEKWIN